MKRKLEKIDNINENSQSYQKSDCGINSSHYNELNGKSELFEALRDKYG